MVTSYKDHLQDSSDLVTSYVETRAGFVSIALEKGRKATPYVEEARVLANRICTINSPSDLLTLKEIRGGLIAASGLSDKAAKHLKEDGCDTAINEFIENFLVPAGEKFGEEVVYRFLLTKGDSLGGSMRNMVGALAQRKLNISITAALHVAGIPFYWLHESTNKWVKYAESNEATNELEIARGLSWSYGKKERTIIYNIKVPAVRNNVDICMFNIKHELFDGDRKKAINNHSLYVALGELKGGIDPAGADEHWKTAKSALDRIARAFESHQLKPLLFFIGAAIETKMAAEIWGELSIGALTNAANLTKPDQITSICQWLINI